MPTNRYHLYSAEPLESVRRVTIWSDDERERSQTDFHLFRVGVSNSRGVDYLGEYDQSKKELLARTVEPLTGVSDLNFPMEDGAQMFIEVTDTGSPPALDGISIEAKGDKIGGTTTADLARTEGDFGHRHEITKNLFSTGQRIVDVPTRRAIEEITTALNTTHRPTWNATMVFVT